MPALTKALEQLRRGGMIILVDDEDRENEGDLVVAAQFATPGAISFMASHGRGLICLAMNGEQVDRLGLPPMAAANRANRSTAFTVSIEARTGITTGISAHDRARTIAVASDPLVHAQDIVSPGHVFPLRAVEGGVLKRDGHTEGSVDLMVLAGLRPSAVICEIMLDDGSMARRPDLDVFARRHGLPILTIAELVRHRLATERLVDEVASAMLPSRHTASPLRMHAFRSRVDGSEHLAMVKHPLPNVPLVRVHSECLTGDLLGSLRCDCGDQLRESMRLIEQSEGGILVYLRGQEGRGIGLANKVAAYALQEKGLDTIEANAALGLPVDARDYATAAQILRSFGIGEIDLLSNNPDKVHGLARYGIRTRQRVPLVVAANPHSQRYLDTKRDRMGHLLPAEAPEEAAPTTPARQADRPNALASQSR